MRGFAVLVIAVLLFGSGAFANEARSYSIDLKYDPGSGRVEAVAKVALKPKPGAKTIVFYLHDELAITAVRLKGKPVVFDQNTVEYEYNYNGKANRIVVQTGGADVGGGLEVVYSGRFSPSSARSPSDYMRGDSDGLYLRSYGYSLWFPVFAPSSSSFPATDFDSVRITAPADFRAVFVGDEAARTVKKGWATAVWKARNIGPSSAQLSIRRFQIKKSGAVTAWFLKDGESAKSADIILNQTAKLLAYFRAHYRADAAAETVHMVQETNYGDISSANMIGLRDANWRAIKRDGRELVILAHELVHSFVQTPTERSEALYAFAIEGFPSYFHLPALESILGADWYDKQLDSVQQRYLERRATGRDRGEALPPEKPIFAIGPDEIGTYKDVFVLNDRAPLALDYLRRKAGQARFDGLVRVLTADTSVTTARFFEIVRAHAPESEADMHLWLETTDYPDRFRRPARSGG